MINRANTRVPEIARAYGLVCRLKHKKLGWFNSEIIFVLQGDAVLAAHEQIEYEFAP